MGIIKKNEELVASTLILLILMLSFPILFSSNFITAPHLEVNVHPESAPAQSPQQNYNYSAILQQIMDLLPAVSSSNGSLYYWINVTFVRDKLSTALQQLGYNSTFMDLYDKYYKTSNVSYQVGISPRQKTLSASLVFSYIANVPGPGPYSDKNVTASINKAWVFFFNFSSVPPSFTLSGPFTKIIFIWSVPASQGHSTKYATYEGIVLIIAAVTIVIASSYYIRKALHQVK